MSISRKKCKEPSWLVLPVTAALMAAGATFNLYAATAAGTEIKNLATVSYEDAAGNPYSAQSNEAIVTVAQVFSATVNSTDTALDVSPGQPVDIAYTLENTGNGTDTYDLTAADGHSNGDDIDADNITIYEDLNNNGQADAGEPVVGSVTLNAGQIKSFVVRAEVPTNAIADEELGITLTAEAQQGTGTAVPLSVTDLTTGPDGLESTVESMLTVTGDAVVVATKSAVHDAAASEITYTVQITNNGNADATNVTLEDAIPENTTFVTGSETTSGLIASNGDTMPGTVVLDEDPLSPDYNNDGDNTDTGLAGLGAVDSVLAPNATITVTYTVSYDPATVPGGTVISNVAYVTSDTDGDGIPDSTVSTNEVNSTTNNTLLVTIADTGENTTGDGINDGQDDDGPNDVQLVDQVSAGEAVIFKNVVANGGNTADVLEIDVSNVSFPSGTVFTVWNEAETVQLSDTNSAYGIDVGSVAAGDDVTITVIAQLPPSAVGAGPYDATVTVSSAADQTVTDTVTDRLTTINASTIDIHNATGGGLDVDDDPIGTPAYSAVNTTAADTGTSVNIPLFIDNDGEAGNSFQLIAGSVYDAATDTVSGLPAGWTVEFFLSDGAGGPTGAPITSTPVVPGLTTDFEIIAVVSIPADQTQAIGNYVGDNDGDGTPDTLDGSINGGAPSVDGDGDYPIFFQISSATTAATDVTLESIDVNPVVAASLSPNGSAQVNPGGTETYVNTLTNNGNATEIYEVVATNTQGTWSNTLSIDTDGDGVADTELTNLTPGTIQVQQPDGITVVTVEVTIGASGPEFALDAGESLPISATVFAPATAPDGQVDVLTITATNVATTDAVSADNQTQVVTGQVSIEKTVAVDTNCDGTAESAYAMVQPSTVTVEPGQCVIWQVVAQNQGAVNAFNVQVNDVVPPFTTFVPGSLSYCLSQNCAPTTVSDTAGDDEGEENAGDVVFYIGTGSTPASGLGGELVSGDFATVRFSVQVD